MSKLRLLSLAFLAIPFLFASCAARASLPPAGGDRGQSALYGTTEVFSRSLARFPQWQDAMARADADRASGRTCAANSVQGCLPAGFADLVARVRDLPDMAKLDAVNRAINAHPYVPTQQNWHRSMYWETPAEFFAKGGQCQDYAIVKYLALKAAGMGDDQLRMLVLHDTALGLDHAVLVATVNGTAYLLDNLNAKVVPASAVGHYRPYYAINQSGYWVLFGGRSMLASGYGR